MLEISLNEDVFEGIIKKMESIENRLLKNEGSKRKTLLTNQDFCDLLKITKRTAQTYRDEGKISFVQIGSKIHYLQSDVDEFLKKHRKKAFYND